MANDNKQGQGQGAGGRMGKDAGKKPFGNEDTQPGLEQEDEGKEQGYDIEVEEPARKEVSPDTWRDRPLGSSHNPRK